MQLLTKLVNSTNTIHEIRIKTGLGNTETKINFSDYLAATLYKKSYNGDLPSIRLLKNLLPTLSESDITTIAYLSEPLDSGKYSEIMARLTQHTLDYQIISEIDEDRNFKALHLISHPKYITPSYPEDLTVDANAAKLLIQTVNPDMKLTPILRNSLSEDYHGSKVITIMFNPEVEDETIYMFRKLIMNREIASLIPAFKYTFSNQASLESLLR